jgi:hypothetical protein
MRDAVIRRVWRYMDRKDVPMHAFRLAAAATLLTLAVPAFAHPK